LEQVLKLRFDDFTFRLKPEMAANFLFRSQTYLGAQFRRLRSRLGAPKAITAMAHRLARFAC
jgi:hypothetical protein